LHDGPARHAILKAVLDLDAEVGLPAAEVVVDIDGGDARLPGPPLQRQDIASHRQGMPEALSPLREFEVIDDVDQEQGGRGLLRRVAVESSLRGIGFRPPDVHTAWRLIVLSASSLRASSVATSSAIVSFRSL